MATPKLRFKEFDGNWTKVGLDKISKVFDGTHQTPNYVESGIKFVSVENIHAPYESDKFITEEAFNKDFKNKPQLNDILMTRITAGEIGATAIVDDREPLAYYVSLALIRPTAKVTTPFLNQYIGTPFFKNELHKRIIHVAFPKKINLGDINECLVSFPEKQEEQTKIASFLSAVDEKISQLTQKHELLSQYKQGMMQKLFSQQMRFKADDGSEFGEWEETALGQIKGISIASGKSSNEKLETAKYHYYGSTGVIGYSNEYDYQGTKILIARVGHNAGYIYMVSGEYNVSDNTLILELPSNLNYIFIRAFLEKIQLNKLVFGTGQPLITGGLLKKVVIQLPCLEEQTKIANFLSSIDQKVEVVAQQIEQAKQWKKGLLQQMFV